MVVTLALVALCEKSYGCTRGKTVYLLTSTRKNVCSVEKQTMFKYRTVFTLFSKLEIQTGNKSYVFLSSTEELIGSL